MKTSSLHISSSTLLVKRMKTASLKLLATTIAVAAATAVSTALAQSIYEPYTNTTLDGGSGGGTSGSLSVIGAGTLSLTNANTYTGGTVIGDREMREDPAARAAWERRQLQDENGRIPDNAIIRAYQQKKAMPFQAKSWREFLPESVATKSDQPNVGGINPSIWVWKGPGNIGGRTRSIVIHPTDPSAMWLGGVSGGIWKTTNGGASWNTMSDFIANLDVSCLALDPTNPNVLYAGTGESTFTAGAGIFKTINGGMTWTQLPNPLNLQYVHRIAISPINNHILVVASYWGIFRSSDAGQTWNRVLNGDSGPHFEQVVFHPTNGTRCLAAGYGRVMFSLDGGLNWAAATGLPSSAGRIELAYAHSNLSIVYASVDYNGRHIYRSSNGGQSFVAVGGAGTGDNGYDGYANDLWVDPTNANRLVVGGVDLWRSTNGGRSFIKISDGIHADEHVIVNHPNFNGSTNKIVYFGNDGGIFRADDIYTVGDPSTPYPHGWIPLNHGLGITQFYGAAGNVNSGTIVGGTQDNGTVRYRTQGGAEGWTTMYGGDGGFCGSDQTDLNYYYGEEPALKIYRSNDAGVSQSGISGLYYNNGYFWKPDPFRIPDAQTGRAGFAAPFVLDPNNASRILAGGASLWRTNDAKTPNTNSSGPSWESIKPALASSSYISAIAVAQGDSDIIWVGYEDGSIYYTTNGTLAHPAWTRANLGSPHLPTRYCERIAIDPQNSHKVYVTFGGYSPDNVWRTTNRGLNWTNISNGLPSAPVRSLVVSPIDSNTLYIGGDVGVFATVDDGTTWSPSNDGPANVEVTELFWMGTRLVAATYGRGLFTAIQVARGDFNGDGKPDYVLFNPSTRQTAIWYLNGAVYVSAASGPTLSAGWVVACSADLNRDGKPDYVLFNASTRQTQVWFLNNAALIGSASGPPLPAGWTLIAAVDFNGDGKPDYVLFNPSTRQTSIWYLNGTVYVSAASGPTLPAGWTLIDAVDFNGDGKPDFLLSNSTNRETAIWYLNGTAHAGSASGPTLHSGWTLQGAADFNADGKPDYVLYQASTRRTALWYLNGPTLVGSAYGPTLTAGYSLASP